MTSKTRQLAWAINARKISERWPETRTVTDRDLIRQARRPSTKRGLKVQVQVLVYLWLIWLPAISVSISFITLSSLQHQWASQQVVKTQEAVKWVPLGLSLTTTRVERFNIAISIKMAKLWIINRINNGNKCSTTALTRTLLTMNTKIRKNWEDKGWELVTFLTKGLHTSSLISLQRRSRSNSTALHYRIENLPKTKAFWSLAKV